MRKNILIADDDEDIREYFEDVLKDHYNVATAEDGLQATKILRERQAQKKEVIDLMVTDMIMPVVDGLNAILECKYEFPSLKIVVVTGSEKMFYKAKMFGVDMALLKPVEGGELVKIIEKILNESNISLEA